MFLHISGVSLQRNIIRSSGLLPPPPGGVRRFSACDVAMTAPALPRRAAATDSLMFVEAERSFRVRRSDKKALDTEYYRFHVAPALKWT